tara:strand:+ start:115 stop:285 length:171 start_codon:yes stop_codon:yes gene_type:complete
MFKIPDSNSSSVLKYPSSLTAEVGCGSKKSLLQEIAVKMKTIGIIIFKNFMIVLFI